MQLVKKLVISAAFLMVFAFLGMSIISLKNNIAASSYTSYWRDESFNDGSYTVFVMGDSFALGLGASNPQNSFVGILKNELGAKLGRNIKIINVAVNEATFENIFDKQLPKLSEYDPDLVIVFAGKKNVDSKKLDLESLEGLISSLASGQSYVIEIPASYDVKRDSQISEYNKIIRETAYKYRIDIVPLYEATNLLKYDLTNYDWDLIHPNNKGHKIWASVIIKNI